MKSSSIGMTGFTLTHGFGEVPALVDVQVKSIEEPNKDFIFTGVGEYRRTGLRQTEPCLRARTVREGQDQHEPFRSHFLIVMCSLFPKSTF